jgi:hypothetical protein
MRRGKLVIEETGGLGAIALDVPAESHGVTPASEMAVLAIGRERRRFHGRGIDWGSGTGLLAIAAARIPAVEHVLGLELVAADVAAARRSAVKNGVEHKTRFLHADSFVPFDPRDQIEMAAWRGRTDFLIANPPASATGDGLDNRRRVLRDAREFLTPGAPVVLQISYQYGTERIAGLARGAPGFRYEGLLATTDWVPFDLDREDLAVQLVRYAEEEQRGGLPYCFADPERPVAHLTARQALERHRVTGEHPITRWQLHLFRHDPPA